MKKNNLVMILAVALMVGVIGFVGGMQYQKSKTVKNIQGFGNLRGEVVQQKGNGSQVGNRTGTFRPVSGEIVDMDGTSITVKIQDGSTKILIYSTSTVVNKTSDGSIADLSIGDTISVVGQESSQGTITAQTISLGGGMFGGNIPPGGSQPRGQPMGQ